ncbi:biotin/lipoate--protein ligase family protein [Humitalea sp. 24SJ18S-53]|uniref:biotin/lipoate--protein ligase family protein n=1 Tax=Humitalea sp. 24SJ18S-53 TaxID=3422307 RepID=UPI003D668698
MHDKTLLELPSLFTPIPLREAGDAILRAVALAPTQGAGTLPWVRSLGRVEVAVVLEPEQPLGTARLALYAAINALADAVASLGPPEIPVALRWPATLLVNAGIAGQARLATPDGASADAMPDWLVVGVEARFAIPAGRDPGHDPGRTSLEAEGWTDTDPTELTAAWARHLMAGIAEWDRDGPKAVADRFLARLEQDVETDGARRGIDLGTADLIWERDGTRHRRAFGA